MASTHIDATVRQLGLVPSTIRYAGVLTLVGMCEKGPLWRPLLFVIIFTDPDLIGNCTSTPPESRGRSVSRGSVNLPAQWNATIWVA